MAYVDPAVVNVGAGALDPAQTVGQTPDSNALMPPQPTTASSMEQYIRQAAIARGMDPNIAVRVAAHEGLNAFDPSKPDHGGDEGSSFGPYQLHYAGMSKSMPHAGLGDDFTASTGLDARDPSTWKQQVDFSLDHAAKNGWGAWMGAKAAGVGEFDGINGAKPVGVAEYTPPSSALSLPTGAPSPIGGNPATPTADNQFPEQPQGSAMLQNSSAKSLMTIMMLKAALQGTQLQRVDYDPWAVVKAGQST